MPYSAEISRNNPACFLFLIDRSGSMKDPISGAGARRKADVVADAINRLFQTLVLRCAKAEGVRDYFQVGVIAYGKEVGPALGGVLAGRTTVSISEIANNPLRLEERMKKVDDGVGGIVDQKILFPVWFEPMAAGKTPMCQTLSLASQVLTEMVNRYPWSFPPMVINISDGVSTDGDPEPSAEALRSIGTGDGDALLFNLHISSTPANPVWLPDSEVGLPDDHARRLFRMSSPLPTFAIESARRDGATVGPNARGFVFNADLVSVAQFLTIGTQVDPGVQN